MEKRVRPLAYIQAFLSWGKRWEERFLRDCGLSFRDIYIYLKSA